jgi:acyl-CoA thioesterase I
MVTGEEAYDNNQMKNIWFVAALAVLGACRQEESASKPAAPSPQPAASAPAPAPANPDKRPVIACFGDSITAGFGLDPGQSFPDLLQRDLDQRGYRYRVANFGVSGDTTQDGLARLSLLMAEKPVIVLLELGANDGLRGLPVSVTRSNLEQIIRTVQSTGGLVILAGMTLPPNYGPDYISKFEAVFQDLTAKHEVLLIPFLLAGVAGSAGLMQKDGLHPNAEGAQRVEETVRKTLEPVLKKQ